MLDKHSDKALLLFIKNPILGKVKTRLAHSLGKEKALTVYLFLLEYTRSITQNLNCDKLLFYDSFVDMEDGWSNQIYKKLLQSGNDLGERMSSAFGFAFESGYKKVVIIGSDCLDLTTNILEQSFEALNQNEVVIGPAKDGGYYLLGLTKHYPQIFANKKWSTDSVYKDTSKDFQDLSIPFSILTELSDIDEETHS